MVRWGTRYYGLIRIIKWMPIRDWLRENRWNLMIFNPNQWQGGLGRISTSTGQRRLITWKSNESCVWVIIHLPLMACCWVGNVCVSPANPWTFGKSACGVASEGVCLTLKILSKTINIHESITYSEERLDDVIPNQVGLNHYGTLNQY